MDCGGCLYVNDDDDENMNYSFEDTVNDFDVVNKMDVMEEDDGDEIMNYSFEETVNDFDVVNKMDVVYEDEEEDNTDRFLYCQPVNLESKFDEAASESSGTKSGCVGTECCICYEIIGERNNCVTECGHSFCLKCLITALTHNNGCPYCRTTVLEPQNPEEDEDEDDDDDDESDDYDDVEENEEFNREYEGDIEDVAERLEKKGITMLDVVSLLFGKYSKRDAKYTNEYVSKLCTMVDQINIDVEQEYGEQRNMEAEDVRV
jgi:hypothetical protein